MSTENEIREQIEEKAIELKQDIWAFLDNRKTQSVEIKETMNYLLDLIDELEEE
jgi:hypothetical protein